MFPPRITVSSLSRPSSLILCNDVIYHVLEFMNFENLCRQNSVSRQFRFVCSRILRRLVVLHSDRLVFPIGAISLLPRRCPNVGIVPQKFFDTTLDLPIELVNMVISVLPFVSSYLAETTTNHWGHPGRTIYTVTQSNFTKLHPNPPLLKLAYCTHTSHTLRNTSIQVQIFILFSHTPFFSLKRSCGRKLDWRSAQ